MEVRKFSMVGPCLHLGEVIRETPSFLIYSSRRHGGAEKRIKKDGERLVHTSPCHSCVDHAETNYPNGYDN